MSLEYSDIEDFQKAAASKLSPENYIYFASGVDNEETVKENCAAYKRWRLRPRYLRDVSNVDMSTTVFGSKIPFPICIAPTALQKKAHPEGEVATARAAASLGTGFTLSIFSHCSMEEVHKQVPNCIKWCHIQIVPKRDFMQHFIRRAEKCGFRAFVVTIDQPFLSKRRNKTEDGRNFEVHHDYTTENLDLSTKIWNPDEIGGIAFEAMYDGTTTWGDIDWLKSITKLPVIVKGVLTEEVATEALKHGVDGMIVSNHGGRQIDGVFSTIDSLSEVVKAVDGRCDVYMDGGIRRGSDVAKAIALGAKAVFVGRPILWGLTCDGTNGAMRVLEILRDELMASMQMLGVSSIEELQNTSRLVVHENEKFSKL